MYVDIDLMKNCYILNDVPKWQVNDFKLAQYM